MRKATVLAVVLLAGRAIGQCQSAWPQRFAPTGLTFNGYPASGWSQAVYDDDGAGPHRAKLYVSGNFDAAGGVSAARIARWTGTAWESVVGGAPFEGPGEMVVFDDDGAGPNPPCLYAIGSVNSAPVIGKWNGQQWTIAASGWPLFTESLVTEGAAARLFVLPDNGTGPLRLYVGQRISHVSPSAKSVSGALFRMDASGWTQVASGGAVNEAVVWDPDGAGPQTPGIYVAHTFSSYLQVGSDDAETRLSRLTATGYIDLATANGVGDPVSYTSLGVFDDDGAGPGAASLYVAGRYPLSQGGAAAAHLSRWNGTSLIPLADEPDGLVSRLQVMSDDPGNPGQAAMYAMGQFTSIGGAAAQGLARWSGSAWSALGPGFLDSTGASRPVQVAIYDDDGAGPRRPFVYAIGAFLQAGYDPAVGIARWDQHYWEPLGPMLNNSVHAMASLNGSLFVGGAFTQADGLAAVSVARWDGQGFATLGSGMNNHIDAFAVHNGRLFAGGKFTAAGGVATGQVAQWDGTLWGPVGSGVYGNVDALVEYGGELYAGGSFSLMYPYIAKWDGSAQWRTVGAGTNGRVRVLCLNGSDLYAAGDFTSAGGVPAPGLARWDGANWHAAPPPPTANITAMASYRGVLHVAGRCSSGACIHALYGSSWYTLPALETGPGDMTIDGLWPISDDGTLWASETFSDAGSVPLTRLVRWDGRSWSVVSAGIDGAVNSIVPYGTGTVYAGGAFRKVGGQTSWYLAGLRPCTAPCYANCDGSTGTPALNVNDFQCFLNRFAAADPAANCDRSTTAPTLNVMDFVCFLNQFAAGCT